MGFNEENWQESLQLYAPGALIKKTAEVQQFRETFLNWYEEEKRELPWRQDTQPYHVWVSEIMLQQTRVETVIPYYLNFMEEFPTVKDFAEAPEEKILKAWEGLGYYSRVRNMQKAAQQVMEDFAGVFPKDTQSIRQLQGIGPYTTGAIASISFDLPEPAIDGNAFRVASRLFGIGEDIAKPKTFKIFDEILRQLIDPVAPGDFNQGLMDLGSQICKPVAPLCEVCPVITFCYGAKSGTAANYPIKSKKMKPKQVYYVAFAVENQQSEFLLSQRASSGLLANLWTFPLVEVSKEEYENWLALSASKVETLDSVAEDEATYNQVNLWQSLQEKAAIIKKDLVLQKKIIGTTTHVFTHLKWHIALVYGRSNQPSKEKEVWSLPENFQNFTFPTLQKKILKLLEKSREE